MLTVIRRILVTALLGALVGLGALMALLGRRPRKPVPVSAEDLVPVTARPEGPAIIPREQAGRAKGGRGLAVGLVALLLLIGLTGIIYESRDTLFGLGSDESAGGGKPLAALAPSTSGSTAEGGPAAKADMPAGSAPEPGGQATSSPGTSTVSSAPDFDTVRVERNGDAVIIGRAPPNATVELLVDGKPVAAAQADGSGRFTVTPPALPTGSSEIGLRSTDAQGRAQRSPARVAVVVAPSPDTEPLVALIAPDKPTVILSQPDRPAGHRRGIGAGPNRQALLGACQVRPDADRALPGAGDAPAQQCPGLSGPDAADPRAAPRASDADDRSATDAGAGAGGEGHAEPGNAGARLRPDPGNAAEVVKPADGPVIATTTPTKIVSIDAQDGGRLFVTGRATAGSALRLYLNDTLIAPATVGRDGTVTFAIGRGVRPGAYKVRLDLVDPATGKVRDRAEVPFSAPAPGHDAGIEYSAARQGATGTAVGQDASAGQVRRDDAPPADERHPPQRSGIGNLAENAPPAEAGSGTAEVSVPGIETARIERGDSLWRVSRRTYGEGERYTLIYDANQDQIRDPDLIYPGQVLVLPSRDTPRADGDGTRD